MRRLIIALLTLAAFGAHAADRYVRQGATGNGSGSDWTNAYTSLPSDLVRGDTYWIADGSYNGVTVKTPGTATITIKKATVASHGTSVGWSDSYGDGQAVLGGLMFDVGNVVIDGATRNENDWTQTSAYGFRIPRGLYSNRVNSSTGACADNVTARYVDIGADLGTGVTQTYGEGLYMLGGSGSAACENWTLQRSHIHNTIVHIQCAGCMGLLVEYTYFGVGWGKEAIRGQNAAANIIIRHNTFKDACQRNPGDSTSGCTGEIALWDGDNFNNVEVYGNVFIKTTSEPNSGGAVIIGGNGSSWVGPSSSNSKVYNNTISGLSYQSGILINGGSNNDCRNNVWINVASGSSPGCKANNTANNVVLSSSPFVSVGSGDFRLATATASGSPLPAPYNVDRLGATRGADGGWDLGAYEYTGGGGAAPLPPPAPLNLQVF